MFSLLQYTRSICKKYNIRPLRRRGQNFLISSFVVEKVIAAAGLDKNDVVVEVGAGLGSLTKAIARHVKKVIAIEIDKKMINVLNNELRDFKNVEIVHGDARKITHYGLRITRYKVIANLPFNITGLMLRKFLGQKYKPQAMVLIVQKEVGERIIAQPPKMNLLAVSVQFYAQVKIVGGVNKKNFLPRPNVDSVILKITTTKYESITKLRNVDEKFFQIVKAGFLHSRKYLLNNLATLPLHPPTSFGGRGSTTFKNSAIIKNTRTLEHKNIRTQEQKQELTKIFKEVGLNPKARAQELSIDEWKRLAKKIENRC